MKNTVKKPTLLFIIFCGAAMSLTSCKKETIETATWHRLQRQPLSSLLSNSTPAPYSSALLSENKIVRISSQAEYDEFANFLTYFTYQGEPLANNSYFDFSTHDLFAFSYSFWSTNGAEVKEKNVYVNKGDKQVGFKLKIAIGIAGSSMNPDTECFLVAIPKQYSNYEIIGTLCVDEKSFLGLDSKDKKIPYTEF